MLVDRDRDVAGRVARARERLGKLACARARRRPAATARARTRPRGGAGTEGAERADRLVVVEALRGERDRLEAGKRERELAPQLPDLGCIAQARLCFLRHGGHLSAAFDRVPSPRVGAAGASILVVEDDPSLRLVCRVNLELDNFRVREADGIEEARAAVAAERPALVFLDLHLGHGASDGFLDELRAEGHSGGARERHGGRDRVRGRATAVMPKPFDPAELVAAAHRHVAS